MHEDEQEEQPQQQYNPDLYCSKSRETIFDGNLEVPKSSLIGQNNSLHLNMGIPATSNLTILEQFQMRKTQAKKEEVRKPRRQINDQLQKS